MSKELGQQEQEQQQQQPTSPPLLPYSGFSEEEIHDILGAVGESASNPPIHDVVQPQPLVEASIAEGGDSNHGSEDGVSAEARAAARSERKRSREKQRRSDVNKRFSDLTTLLRRIETEDQEAGACIPLLATGPTNRVDLIARTIAALERIHESNKKRTREVAELTRQLEESKKIASDTAARLKEATAYQQFSKPVSIFHLLCLSILEGMELTALAGNDDGTHDDAAQRFGGSLDSGGSCSYYAYGSLYASANDDAAAANGHDAPASTDTLAGTDAHCSTGGGSPVRTGAPIFGHSHHATTVSTHDDANAYAVSHVPQRPKLGRHGCRHDCGRNTNASTSITTATTATTAAAATATGKSQESVQQQWKLGTLRIGITLQG